MFIDSKLKEMLASSDDRSCAGSAAGTGARQSGRVPKYWRHGAVSGVVQHLRAMRRNSFGVMAAAESFRIAAESSCRPIGDEMAVCKAAYRDRLPVTLKGPAGCGKTRFVQ